MKIQVDLDGELWAKFRSKVHHEGKTLGSVVPTIFEPALRAYLDPPKCSECAPPILATKEEAEKIIRESANRGFPVLDTARTRALQEPTTIETAPIEFTGPTTEKKLVAVERISPPLPTVKRCELCDQVVDRLFASAGRKVCYACWKNQLSAP